MRGKIFEINIHGVNVEVVKNETENDFWFCAYAELKNSRFLDNKFLGITYRDGDKVGVDTMHARNEDQTETEKFMDVLIQIEDVIEKWKEAIRQDI